jgi:hypothetical protein
MVFYIIVFIVVITVAVLGWWILEHLLEHLE